MLRPTDQPLEVLVDPNQPLDFGRLGVSVGIVAIVAASLIFVFGSLAGPPSSWLRPKWVHPPPAWFGFLIAAAFFGCEVVVGATTAGIVSTGWYASGVAEEDRMLSTLAARTIITPLFIIVLTFVRVRVIGPTPVPSLRRVAGWIALGAAAWFVLHPATTGVHLLTLLVKQELGGPIDSHPLAKLPPTRDGFGGALFGLAVCAMTPWVEEYFFRGLLIPWTLRGRYRPFALLMLALMFPLLAFGDWRDPHYAALLFAGVLGVVLFACQCLPKGYPKRTILTVVSSSALFAAAHSAVWPSPIPLFVFALGLGYLTARTGSIVPGVVVHGLFNGASFVYLLRGPMP